MAKLVRANKETAANEQTDLLSVITKVLGVKLKKVQPDLYAGFSVQRPTPGKVIATTSQLKSAGFENSMRSFQSMVANVEDKPRVGFYRIDARVSDISRATIGIDMNSGVVTVKIMS